jgi:hypothetical protein
MKWTAAGSAAQRGTVDGAALATDSEPGTEFGGATRQTRLPRARLNRREIVQ